MIGGLAAPSGRKWALVVDHVRRIGGFAYLIYWGVKAHLLVSGGASAPHQLQRPDPKPDPLQLDQVTGCLASRDLSLASMLGHVVLDMYACIWIMMAHMS